MTKFYTIRKAGTDFYLTSKHKEIWGHRNRAYLFKKEELVKFLKKVYEESDFFPEEFTSGVWQIAEYTLLEQRSFDAEDFLVKNTKSPLIKL